MEVQKNEVIPWCLTQTEKRRQPFDLFEKEKTHIKEQTFSDILTGGRVRMPAKQERNLQR